MDRRCPKCRRMYNWSKIPLEARICPNCGYILYERGEDAKIIKEMEEYLEEKEKKDA